MTTSLTQIDHLRAAIITKKKIIQDMIDRGRNDLDATDKLTVMIKPTDHSSTEDLISVLDEMSIDAVPVYAILDITPQDLVLIENAGR